MYYTLADLVFFCHSARLIEVFMIENIVIATFYKFVPLEDFEEMKAPLKRFCIQHNLKGTILLAKEGINSTISGECNDINALMTHLRNDPRLADLTWKESFFESKPFERMKVRLKKEIVRMGLEDLDMDRYQGTYVNSKDWDQLISDPDVAVIDTRNDYEIKIGTFEGAIDPKTQTFRQFPQWAKHWAQDALKDKKKVAMFCTGGIRCEKSTAYMKSLGFDEVYHLKGGILQYFEDTHNNNHKWQGECFVFDDRVAVDASLKPTGALLCNTCGAPVTTDDLRDGPKNEVVCVTCVGI